MNLKEEVIRINEMMGNSDKVSTFQKILNLGVENLRDICENMNSEDDEYVSFEACDLIDSGLKITLSEIGGKDGEIIFYVNISYFNMFHIDEETFCIELQDVLNSWVGKNKVIVREYTNRYQGDW